MTVKEKQQSGELYDTSDRELFYSLNGRLLLLKGQQALINAADT
ncbi:hypothetical protein [Ruminococcus sp.]|nr:hypothetical protein [Ruminococcus sp.]